jgi:predicted nucleotidyltransferase
MSSSDPQQEQSALLTPVVQALRQGLGKDLVSVVLFGSQARGEADANSDWDLLLLARRLPEKPWQRHTQLKRLLPEAWRGRVSLLAKTPAEFEAHLPALYLDIALDGVVLYDTGNYMAQRLAYLRELLARRGLRRERAGVEMIWRWQQAPGPDWALEWERTP